MNLFAWWPFAWKTTVETLTLERDFAHKWNRINEGTLKYFADCLEAAVKRSNDWESRCRAAHDRIAELADPKRTTPQTMAEVFACYDEKQQAEFFEALTVSVKDWGQPPCLQWHAMGKHLSFDARYLVQGLAEFSDPSEPPWCLFEDTDVHQWYLCPADKRDEALTELRNLVVPDYLRPLDGPPFNIAFKRHYQYL